MCVERSSDLLRHLRLLLNVDLFSEAFDWILSFIFVLRFVALWDSVNIKCIINKMYCYYYYKLSSFGWISHKTRLHKFILVNVCWFKDLRMKKKDNTEEEKSFLLYIQHSLPWLYKCKTFCSDLRPWMTHRNPGLFRSCVVSKQL